MGLEDKIIKANVSGPSLASQKVVKREVFSASQEADEIRAVARREAEQLLILAQQQAAELLEASRQQGYQAGLLQWNEAVLDATTARGRFLLEAEPEMVKLALKIAQKIVGDHLRADPESIVGIVREALKSVGREKTLTIRVNHEHFERVRARIAVLQEAVGASREIQVVASDLVTPGGCIVESELGKIDAQLETQLKCLEDLLVKGAHA